MNLKTKKVEELERIGYTGESIHHGMGEWIFTDDPSKVNLFYVNHMSNGSCITIYEHKLGTTKLIFLKNVCHPKIHTPNDVAPVGPLQFYITNDHRFRDSFLRKIENSYGPFSFHEVVYCDASGDTVKCKTAASGGMEYPNGIIAIDDGAQVLVADTLSGHIFRFAVNAQTHALKLLETIKTGVHLDNFARIRGSRDLTVAGFPDIVQLFQVVYHPTDYSVQAPAYSVRLTPATVGSTSGSVIRPAYSDDGSIFSAVTVYVTDDKLGLTLGGSVSKAGLLYCDHSI